MTPAKFIHFSVTSHDEVLTLDADGQMWFWDSVAKLWRRWWSMEREP